MQLSFTLPEFLTGKVLFLWQIASHHRTRCHGNKTFSFSCFDNVLKVFRDFSRFSSVWPFSIHCASYAGSAMFLFFKTQTKNNPQNCSLISTDCLSAIRPSYSLSLSFKASAFYDNLTQKQQFALCGAKLLCLCSKSLPKCEEVALLPWTCLADGVFPCYTMQLNVIQGIGGEEEGGVRISTHGKKVMKCAFTAMISISAVSMPYSLCCET